MKKIIAAKAAPAAIGAYSQAVLIGKTLYLSGQIPLDPATMEIVEGGLTAQTTRVLENIKAVLTEAGFDLNDVLKCTIFITDMEYFGKVNEIYARYFSVDPPARSCVAVAGLPRGALVEIECVAAKE